MRTRSIDPRCFTQFIVAALVIATACLGIRTSQPQFVSGLAEAPERSIPGSPTPTPIPTPTPSPAPTAQPDPTATPIAATVQAAPASPTDTPEDPAEQKRIAASLTNGPLYKSGGGYGVHKGATVGRTRIEIEAYALGAGPDTDVQVSVRIWEPGLVTGVTFDYGDGSPLKDGVSPWSCNQKNRPMPLHASWGDHHYEPGRYTLRTSVTTGSCDGFAETGELSDIHTVEASVEFEMTDKRVIGPVY